MKKFVVSMFVFLCAIAPIVGMENQVVPLLESTLAAFEKAQIFLKKDRQDLVPRQLIDDGKTAMQGAKECLINCIGRLNELNKEKKELEEAHKKEVQVVQETREREVAAVSDQFQTALKKMVEAKEEELKLLQGTLNMTDVRSAHVLQQRNIF